MKKQLTQVRAKAFAIAMALAIGTFVLSAEAPVMAQGQSGHAGHSNQTQSGDMPYDLHFIDMMMMHHRQGIEMAKLAEEKAENPRVKAFATRTRAGQEKDIPMLQSMRDRWYKDQPAMEHAGMQGMSHDEMQKKMQEQMNDLRDNSGHGFDHQFVDLMAAHHKEAVTMAKEAIAKAEHTDVRTFARTMMNKQQREIGQLNNLRVVLKKSHNHPPASPRRAARPTRSKHARH